MPVDVKSQYPINDDDKTSMQLFFVAYRSHLYFLLSTTFGTLGNIIKDKLKEMLVPIHTVGKVHLLHIHVITPRIGALFAFIYYNGQHIKSSAINMIIVICECSYAYILIEN